MRQWIAAARGGPQSSGSFLNAGPISEAVNLYAIALRTGKKLLYDGADPEDHQCCGCEQIFVPRIPKGLGSAIHLREN